MQNAPALSHPLITPEHLRRKAVVYLRQSSLEQVEKRTGSQAYQRNQADLARDYGWTEDLIEVIDEDLGKSGSTVERRTGWQRMLDQIAAHAVGCVFAVNISRLGRELLALEHLRVMALHHGTLLCLENRFIDPSNPNDTVLAQITGSIAQYENKKRAEHMTYARIAKAKEGSVVSTMPIGWIKGADGKYDYDPAVKDAIRSILDTFFKVRSIRRTMKELAKMGVKIPRRHRKNLNFSKPTLEGIRRILMNPAYAGTYVYGKTESQRAGSVSAYGRSGRVRVPEHRWVKWPNHHPAYMTEEQQEEIKVILKNNHFMRRDRVGRGPALTQGLLRCAVCKRSLSVNYSRNKSYSYGCGWDTEPCTRFISFEFDQYVLAEVFKVLRAPPLEMLQAALEDSRKQERARVDWIESERERLEHEERRANERAELTRGSLPRVHFDALTKIEKVLQEREEFERKIAFEQSAPKPDDSEEDLEELSRLASDVPALWDHPVVTNQERKEILRCLIDHVVVAATKQKIDAKICWKSGGQTPLTIWRDVGRYNLIRELHAQKLTVLEIKEYLAAGKTSNGQVVKITVGRLYMILRKLGLEPYRFPANYLALRQKALELNRHGHSLGYITDHFIRQGFKSASGKPWTGAMVYGLIRALGNKVELLEDIHHRAIADARARGLNYKEMAIEFNEQKIRRRDGQRWTAFDIKNRWANLNILKRNRLQKERTNHDGDTACVVRL